MDKSPVNANMANFADGRQLRRRNFSLIELLTVIAVIAILAGMISPVLHMARERGRMTNCSNHIRQLVIANHAYATDNGEHYMPNSATMAGGKSWMGETVGGIADFTKGHMYRYIGKNPAVLVCPSWPYPVADFTQVDRNAGIGYNQQYIGSHPTHGRASGINAGAVRKPTETVMFADAARARFIGGEPPAVSGIVGVYPGTVSANGQNVHFRHNGRAMVGWVDGHASSKDAVGYKTGGTAPDEWYEENEVGFFDPAADLDYFFRLEK